jgi:hypothetical protein
MVRAETMLLFVLCVVVTAQPLEQLLDRVFAAFSRAPPNAAAQLAALASTRINVQAVDDLLVEYEQHQLGFSTCWSVFLELLAEVGIPLGMPTLVVAGAIGAALMKAKAVRNPVCSIPPASIGRVGFFVARSRRSRVPPRSARSVQLQLLRHRLQATRTQGISRVCLSERALPTKPARPALAFGGRATLSKGVS